MLADVRHEARARCRGRFPAGSNAFSMRVTQRFRHDPLEVLLEMRERHGPVFGLRLLYGMNVFLIGPEANHFMLVSGRDNFAWRPGRLATCSR